VARSKAYRWRNLRTERKHAKVVHRKLEPEMASEKQLAYIRGLARQLGIPVPDGIATKRGASHVIEDLKKRRERRGRESDERRDRDRFQRQEWLA